ncbi:nesprin-2 isoform X4 [Polypterus senegalus]|uniref:nesprin-2 isoform X4 n=1 Tax=Polypterus senegalus TaxID=55291 RepID=UPI001963840A|nr:nesprin-2 isoform X4 [Polypterus senegalus]
MMADEGVPGDFVVEEGQIPVDIDNIHLLLQVEHEQVQKRTFTNWINAQLAKHKTPTVVLDLFSDIRNGNRLLDLLEVLSGESLKHEKGQGIFKWRSNIETALNFLKRKSIKLVNINVPDIIEGKPCIVLGLIWTIILHFHIEELANTLTFSSHQSSLESLVSVESCSTTDSSSSKRGAPMHKKFKMSAKKALLHWAKEHCARVDSDVTVTDFKASWRSGHAFLAILHSLRPDLIDLQKMRSRTNLENLEEAFRIADNELRIPRLLEPEDVDINNPDEKSIMTYVAQFLQYSRDLPPSEEEMQTYVTPSPSASLSASSRLVRSLSPYKPPKASLAQNIKDVILWVQCAERQLTDAFMAAQSHSYADQFCVFQTIVTSFHDQKRSVMPFLSALKRAAQMTPDQVELRLAWNRLLSKIGEYKAVLDHGLPPPLDGVGAWLQNIEPILEEVITNPEDPEAAVVMMREKRHHLKQLMEEADSQMEVLRDFLKVDKAGADQVPPQKTEDIKKRVMNARINAKYLGIKLEYLESKHSTLALLHRLNCKVQQWKGKYGSQESVRRLLRDWHGVIEEQSLIMHLHAAVEQLKSIGSSYTNRSALANDSAHIQKFLAQLDSECLETVESAQSVKSLLERVVRSWDVYMETFQSLQSWLERHPEQATLEESLTEWEALHAQVNEVGNFLIEVSDEETMARVSKELSRLNRQWCDVMKNTRFENVSSPSRSPSMSEKITIPHKMEESSMLLWEDLDVSSSAQTAFAGGAQAGAVCSDTVNICQEVMEESIKKRAAGSEVQPCIVASQESTADQKTPDCASEEGIKRQFENSKEKLQSYLSKVLDLLQEQQGSEESVSRYEETLQKCDPKILEEFLEAAEQMKTTIEESFHDVRVKWQAAHSEIPLYLKQLKFETRRGKFQDVATECELQLKKELEQIDSVASAVLIEEHQAWFSPEGKFGCAEQHLTVMKEVCDMLTCEKTNNLMSAQLTKCEERKTDIQNQAARVWELLHRSSVERQSPGGGEVEQDSCVRVSFVELPITVSTGQVTVTAQNLPVVQRAMKENVEEGGEEEDLSEVDLIQRYGDEKKKLNVQFIKNKQLLSTGFPDIAEDLFSLQSRHLELEAALQVTESIHSKLVVCSSKGMKVSKQKDKSRVKRIVGRLSEEWKEQKGQLQERMKSIELSLGIITPLDNEVSILSTTVEEFRAMPRIVHGVTIRDAEELPMILKNFYAVINKHLVTCEALANQQHPDLEALNPKDIDFIQAFALKYKFKLQQLGGQLHHSEEALEKLQDFLLSVQGAESELAALETASSLEGLEKLKMIQQKLEVLSSKAEEVNCLVKTAGLCLKDESSGQDFNCSELVDSVMPKIGHTDTSLIQHREALHQAEEEEEEKAIRSFCLKKEELISSLQEIQDEVDSTGLEDATQLGVQFRRFVLAHPTTHQNLPVVQRAMKENFEEGGQEHKEEEEEDLSEVDLIQRYGDEKKKLNTQFIKNKQLLSTGFPDIAEDLFSLQSRHLELEAALQVTESIHSKLVVCSSKGMKVSKQKDKSRVKRIVGRLSEEWKEQKGQLQERMKSIELSLGILTPLDNEVSILSTTVEEFRAMPRIVHGVTMRDAEELPRILKNFYAVINKHLVTCEVLANQQHSDLEALNPKDIDFIQAFALKYKFKLQQLGGQLHHSEEALEKLQDFLLSVQGAESELAALETASSLEGLEKLKMLQQKLEVLSRKAEEVNCLVKTASLCLKDESSGQDFNCSELVDSVMPKIGHTDTSLIQHREALHQAEEEEEEKAIRSFCLKKEELISSLQEIQDEVDSTGLEDATQLAVQFRLRCLKKLEERLRPCRKEIDHLTQLANQLPAALKKEPIRQLEDLEAIWEEMQRTLSDRQEQSDMLLTLVKRFQNFCGSLSSDLQRAECSISERSSYMSKENLQKLIDKVENSKVDLAGCLETTSEMQSLSRQIQALLRKIPNYKELRFEAEEHALVDHCLDVTEKADAYLDDLRRAMGWWEALLALSVDIEGWTDSKLVQIAEHPYFDFEQDIIALQDEIHTQEKNIEHFHQKSADIQKLLQSAEPSLELQVIETQLRKKMAEVMELFKGSKEVFEQTTALRDTLEDKAYQLKSSVRDLEAALFDLPVSDHLGVFEALKGIDETLLQQDSQCQCLLEELHSVACIASANLSQLNQEVLNQRNHIEVLQNAVLQKRHLAEQSFLEVLNDEMKIYEDWMQDLQLSVNECFEIPEGRAYIEAHLHKLQGFLASEEATMKMHLFETHFKRVREYLPESYVCHISCWMEDQNTELNTFKSHCQLKQASLEESLRTVEKLVECNSLLGRWLDSVEKTMPPVMELPAFQLEIESKRKAFDDLTGHVDSLKMQGLTTELAVQESLELIRRFHSLWERASKELEGLKPASSTCEQGVMSSQETPASTAEEAMKEKPCEDISQQQIHENLSEIDGLKRSKEEPGSHSDKAGLPCHPEVKEQVITKLTQVSQQKAELPQKFQWPEAADKQAALDKCQTLSEEAKNLLGSMDTLKQQLEDESASDKDSAKNVDMSYEDLLRHLQATAEDLEGSLSQHQGFFELLTDSKATQLSLHEEIQSLQVTLSSKRAVEEALERLKGILESAPHEVETLTQLSTLGDSLKLRLTSSGCVALTQELENLHAQNQDTQNRLMELRERYEDLCFQLPTSESPGQMSQEQEKRSSSMRKEARDHDHMDKGRTLENLNVQVENLQSTSDASGTHHKCSGLNLDIQEDPRRQHSSFADDLVQPQNSELPWEMSLSPPLPDSMDFSFVAPPPTDYISEPLEEVSEFHPAKPLTETLSRDKLPDTQGQELVNASSPWLPVPKPDPAFEKRNLQHVEQPEESKELFEASRNSPLEMAEWKSEEQLEAEGTSLLLESKNFTDPCIVSLDDGDLMQTSSNSVIAEEYEEKEKTVQRVLAELSEEWKTLKTSSFRSSKGHPENIQDFLRTIEKEKFLLRELRNRLQELPETDRQTAHVRFEELEQRWEQLEAIAEGTNEQISLGSQELCCVLEERQDLQSFQESLQNSCSLASSSPDKLESGTTLHTDVSATGQRLDHLKKHSEELLHSSLREEDGQNSLMDLQQKLELLQEKVPVSTGRAEGPATVEMAEKLKRDFERLKALDSNLTCESKIALFPEDLRSSIKQLSTTLSEVVAMHPDMDTVTLRINEMAATMGEAEVSSLLSLLQTIVTLIKTVEMKTSEKLQKQQGDLKAREDLFERIESLALWLRLHGEKSLPVEEFSSESMSYDFEGQVNETTCILQEADEKQKVMASLLSESQEISDKLSVTENDYLSERLKSLQKGIGSVTQGQKRRLLKIQELMEAHQRMTAQLKGLEDDISKTQHIVEEEEATLTQQTLSLSRSLPLKVSELRSQLEQLKLSHFEQPVKVSQVQSKLEDLEAKLEKLLGQVTKYENFEASLLNLLVLQGSVEEQMLLLKEEGCDPVSRLAEFQRVLQDSTRCRALCEQANENFKMISSMLDLSLKKTTEMKLETLMNDCNRCVQVLQEESAELEEQLSTPLEVPKVQEAAQDFLRQKKLEMQQPLCVSLDPSVIEQQLHKCEALQSQLDSLGYVARAQSIKKRRPEVDSSPDENVFELEELEEEIREDCLLRMEMLMKAQEMVRRYDAAVKEAFVLLDETEAKLLSSPVHPGNCEQLLQQIEDDLVASEDDFEHRIDDIQNFSSLLQSLPNADPKVQHAKVLSDLLTRKVVLGGQLEIRRQLLQRCAEEYQQYKHGEDKLSAQLHEAQSLLAGALSAQAESYQECLQCLDKLKSVSDSVDQAEDGLVCLKELAQGLQKEWSVSECLQGLGTLSCLHIQLSQTVREQLALCEEQTEAWKAVNEKVEKASVLLDTLQHDLPGTPTGETTTAGLLDLLTYLNEYDSQLSSGQAALSTLIWQVKGIVGISENCAELPSSCLFKELQEMQDRYTNLKQKVANARQVLQTDMQERDAVKAKIEGVREWLVTCSSLLSKMKPTPRATQLREIQEEVDNQKGLIKKLMEQLRIKYSDMYTIVPVEIETQLQDVSRTLKEVQKEVDRATEQSSSTHVLQCKIDEISSGLQRVQEVLGQKSKTIDEAKDAQKYLWDDMDMWHSKLTTVEAELQDLAEESPDQAQPLMDSLMEPLKLYQELAKQSEQKTSVLTKITVLLQDYAEMINSNNAWLAETSGWLSTAITIDSVKSLNKVLHMFQVKLDDSVQRQKAVRGFSPFLREISLVFDTTDIEKQLGRTEQNISAQQQALMDNLNQLQQLAAEVQSVETELSRIEINIEKIRIILSSGNMRETFPEEHLRNRQVILENIQSMRGTIAAIQSFQPSLPLLEDMVSSLHLVEKAEQLLQPLEDLEQVTFQQNALLETALQALQQKQQKDGTGQHMSEDSSDGLHTQEGSGYQEISMGGLDANEDDFLTSLGESLVALVAQTHNIPGQLEGGSQEDKEPAVGLSKSQYYQFPAKGDYEDDPDDGGSSKSSSSETLTGSIQEEGEEMAEERAVPWQAQSDEVFEVQAVPRHMKLGPEELQTEAQNPEPLADGPLPQHILHACWEQAEQLEVWLESAARTLQATMHNPAMQQSVEQQLLTCQKMFQEIERKVVSLSDVSQRDEQTDGAHEEAEALSAKLELLRSSLLSFQVLLQDQRVEEQDFKHSSTRVPSDNKLQRQPSVQEMLASAKTTLRRQDSLQQQKELEMELTEQKTLTKYLAEQGEKASLQSTQMEDPARPRLPSRGAEHIFAELSESPRVEREAALTTQEQTSAKWKLLQSKLSSKLKTLEETLQADLMSQVLITVSSSPISDRFSICSSGPCSFDLQTHVSELRGASQDVTFTLSQASPPTEDITRLEQKLHHVLGGVHLSLGRPEDMLWWTSELSRGAAEQHLRELEKFSSDLSEMHQELDNLRDPVVKCEGLMKELGPLISDCVASLQMCTSLLRSAVSSRNMLLQERLQQMSEHQSEISQVHASLFDCKSLVQHKLNEVCEQGLAEQLEAVEHLQSALEQQERQVMALLENGESQLLPVSAMHEIYKLEDALDHTCITLRAKKGELKESLAVENQYERLLNGLADLVEVGRAKLVPSQRLTVPSQAALKTHLKKHKSFFCSLSHRLSTLENFTHKVSPRLAMKYGKSWTDLAQNAATLLEQSHQHGIQLQGALQAWKLFDKNYGVILKHLLDLEVRIPSVGLVEESDEKLKERLAIYQQIETDLEENSCGFQQTLAKGRKLLSAVDCFDLEAQIKELEDRWVVVTSRTGDEQRRLEMLMKLWASFRADSVLLNHWMMSSMERIRSWKQQSLSVPQELHAAREHLTQFLEFMKETDAQSALKTSVICSGSLLLQLKDTDSASLQTQMAQFEQAWAELLSHLPEIQDKLHQQQIEKISSCQGIGELDTWIDHTSEHLAEDKRTLTSLSGAAAIKERLLKYKEYKVDMNCLQLTVDFVNQSVLQISSPDICNRRYERTDFAELLGATNLRWQTLQGSLNTQIRCLEDMLETCRENERKTQLLSSWCESQRTRLAQLEKLSSQNAVANALKECQGIEEKLKIRSAKFEEDRQKCQADQDSAHMYADFRAQAEDTALALSALSHQIIQIKTSLQSAAQMWDAFDKMYDTVEQDIIRVRYVLDYIPSDFVSGTALQQTAERLKSLQAEAEKSEESWSHLSEQFTRLSIHCRPSAVALLSENLQVARRRWAAVNDDLVDRMFRTQESLRLRQKCEELCAEHKAQLGRLEDDCQKVLTFEAGQDSTMLDLQGKVEAVKDLLSRTEDTKNNMAGKLKLSQDVTRQRESSEADTFIKSESANLSKRVALLHKSLQKKLSELQGEIDQIEQFGTFLASLENRLKETEGMMKSVEGPCSLNEAKAHLRRLNSLSPELESLNELIYKTPVKDAQIKAVQTLNRQWLQICSQAVQSCSELQENELQKQTFVQKCEDWMKFLKMTEDCLAVDVAGSYEGLRDQQKIHECFQAEASLGQQILHSVITEASRLLEHGEVDNSNEFLLKLSMLKDRWRGVILRVHQRKGIVDGLVRQWHHYQDTVKRLKNFLTDTRELIAATSSGTEAWAMKEALQTLEDIKHTQVLFHRWSSGYQMAMETGRHLFSMADIPTERLLQEELCELQDSWEQVESLTADQKRRILSAVESWKRCENKITESGCQLQNAKMEMMGQSREVQTDLQKMEHFLEEAWELDAMKSMLPRFIIAEDTLVLDEQIEGLHTLWEDLCYKVSLRKQEITDRLNAWIIFNEKSKELCDWMAQMENKVSQNSELSIEEMVEKLKKDCMEEINLFSENKTHLKQLGEQLIKASDKTKEVEINEKLKDLNDRWQHLFDHIDARVKKLKETLQTVHQLDKNMSNLRTWLSRIESELSKPVIYDICDNDEIQRKLAEQQDLQRDIEQHSDGVASVLNLCDVILHDSDACTTETECDSIQQTTRSLDRRWRNICALSMERRLKIEETWRLWCKFLEDYSRFEDWLKTAERTAAAPNSSEVLYTNAKEELKKFEAFQRQVHERLTQLELVNKQYRRLARENRTDSASKLKLMVHEGNQRWDNLQKRVAAILRRLKHFTSQREEFEGTRDNILVWLTEMDLQLTNVEHFSESDIEDKMRQLNGFQQEITLNTNKIDQLIVFGENLIQKCEPLDAVLIEDELEELHSYCQEVFGRVARFHHRLINKGSVMEDKELSDRETDLEDSGDMATLGWQEKMGAEVSPGRQSLCHLMPPPMGHERSGRETPVSIDSIPLEWDHTVDVGGSSSHEDEEDAPYYSALSGSEPPSWHSPQHQNGRKRPLHQDFEGLPSSLPDTSTPFKPGYAKLMSECSDTIDTVKRVKLILNDEPQTDEQGLVGLRAADKQTGVIERWELIQAQQLSNELRMKQDLQQEQQVNCDLEEISSWLSQVGLELDQLQKLDSLRCIEDTEVNVNKLKDIQKAYDNYKAFLISINLNKDNSARVQEQLKSVNQTWKQVTQKLENWKDGLQVALMQCQDFHETTHNLLLWLAHAESRRFTVDLSEPNIESSILLKHQTTLKQLESELLEKQLNVNSLQDISSHLLEKANEEDYTEAKEKVHVIATKLKMLLREVSQDLETVQEKLDKCSSSVCLDETDQCGVSQAKEASVESSRPATTATGIRAEMHDSPPRRSFFYRVFRAAFPLQLLFLLLLILTCLVPLSEEDYSCSMSNNFARSFYPMLRYTNGPPPT